MKNMTRIIEKIRITKICNKPKLIDRDKHGWTPCMYSESFS